MQWWRREDNGNVVVVEVGRQYRNFVLPKILHKYCLLQRALWEMCKCCEFAQLGYLPICEKTTAKTAMVMNTWEYLAAIVSFSTRLKLIRTPALSKAILFPLEYQKKERLHYVTGTRSIINWKQWCLKGGRKGRAHINSRWVPWGGTREPWQGHSNLCMHIINK